MSEQKRDPGIYPKAGDVLRGKDRHGEPQVRRVEGVVARGNQENRLADDIRYEVLSTGSTGRKGSCFMSYWRRWAKDADVIHHAG